jgi:two-component system, cell cycle sensor histidine kinase and response regulator CckA
MGRPSRRTILVVEDEPQVRRMIRLVLRAEGFNVIEAGNAAQAIELSRCHAAPIDLAVIDVVMPGMCGLDLASWFDPERPGMKVLYISGMASTVAVESLATGAPALLLRKPFSRTQLLERVGQLLPADPVPSSS